MMKSLAVVAAVVLIVLAAGCTQKTAPPVDTKGAAPTPLASTKAPASSGAEKSSVVQQLDSASFDAAVLKAATPVLVDFYATWCGPCKRLSPILDEMATERAGKVKFVRVDVDQSKDIAARYKIEAMPTLVMFKGGKEATRWVGFREKSELAPELDKAAK